MTISGTSGAPNVVLIIADHDAYYRHGWDEGPRVLRPRFDRFRQDGVTFERAYSVSPLCSPARRTILSGLYPHQHGELGNNNNVPFVEPTFFSRFKQAGYDLSYYGKWHAGPDTAKELGADGICYPVYNNPYTKPEYQQYLSDRGLPRPVIEVERAFDVPWFKDTPNVGRYEQRGKSSAEAAFGVLTTPEDTHDAYFLANVASEKLDRLKNEPSENPFAMVLSMWGPHHPYFPTQRFLDMYDPSRIPRYGSLDDDLGDKTAVHRSEWTSILGDNDKLVYPSSLTLAEWQRMLVHCYAQITMVDDAIGRFLDKLDESGLAENTIVIWLDDHGDAIASHGGHFDKRSYLTEEVVRIPFALRWAGRVAGGQVVRNRVSQIDVLPTFLDAAGLEPIVESQGRSVLALANEAGLQAEDWREDVLVETHGHGEAVLGRAAVGSRYKYVDYGDAGEELYDLVTDPYELHNLVLSTPDRHVLADMRRRLRRLREDSGDPTLAPSVKWEDR